MSKKDHEKILLDRFRKAGLKPNQVQLDAPFSFVVSPTTTSGVDTNESGSLAREFGNGVVEDIARWTMHSPITGIVVFPRILDPNIAKIPDHLTFKRKERAVFVGVNILFDRWATASFPERIEIFAETFVKALGKIAPRYLHPMDKDRLTDAVFVIRETINANHDLPPKK